LPVAADAGSSWSLKLFYEK